MSNEEIRKELELQLERFIQLKDRLDNKANNMIAMTGTIATLFTGFGIFLLSDVYISDNNWVLMCLSAITLMVEIIATILTIHFALNSYKLRDYYHPFGFQKLEMNGEFSDQKLRELNDMKNPNFNENMLYNYYKSVKSYENQNEKQVIGINNAQITFKIALGAIPVFTILMILIKYVG